MCTGEQIKTSSSISLFGHLNAAALKVERRPQMSAPLERDDGADLMGKTALEQRQYWTLKRAATQHKTRFANTSIRTERERKPRLFGRHISQVVSSLRGCVCVCVIEGMRHYFTASPRRAEWHKLCSSVRNVDLGLLNPQQVQREKEEEEEEIAMICCSRRQVQTNQHEAWRCHLLKCWF